MCLGGGGGGGGGVVGWRYNLHVVCITGFVSGLGSHAPIFFLVTIPLLLLSMSLVAVESLRYEALLNKFKTPPLNLTTQTIYVQQCYDAIWTLARAINLTIQGIANSIVKS